MNIVEGRERVAASDVANFLACQELTQLDLRAVRGMLHPPRTRPSPCHLVAGEASRGLEFLYDRHRLNVATSRARAMAIIVASPGLIRVSCRTPHQMTLVNALCRAWETPA